MSDTIISLLPLILMTLIFFFVNRWIGKRCGVWGVKHIILSLTPVLSYFATILIFVDAVVILRKRIDELESTEIKPEPIKIERKHD